MLASDETQLHHRFIVINPIALGALNHRTQTNSIEISEKKVQALVPLKSFPGHNDARGGLEITVLGKITWLRGCALRCYMHVIQWQKSVLVFPWFKDTDLFESSGSFLFLNGDPHLQKKWEQKYLWTGPEALSYPAFI